MMLSLNLRGDSVLVIELVANLQAGRLIMLVNYQLGYSFLLLINVLKLRAEIKISVCTYNTESENAQR